MRLAGWICAETTKLTVRIFANRGNPELASSSEACESCSGAGAVAGCGAAELQQSMEAACNTGAQQAWDACCAVAAKPHGSTSNVSVTTRTAAMARRNMHPV